MKIALVEFFCFYGLLHKYPKVSFTEVMLYPSESKKNRCKIDPLTFGANHKVVKCTVDNAEALLSKFDLVLFGEGTDAKYAKMRLRLPNAIHYDPSEMLSKLETSRDVELEMVKKYFDPRVITVPKWKVYDSSCSAKDIKKLCDKDGMVYLKTLDGDSAILPLQKTVLLHYEDVLTLCDKIEKQFLLQTPIKGTELAIGGFYSSTLGGFFDTFLLTQEVKRPYSKSQPNTLIYGEAGTCGEWISRHVLEDNDKIREIISSLETLVREALAEGGGE